ncbi:MAG: carboxypeptidase regulatory-like domain-containing protein, partial [Anaerolineae bacterium]|nr:carboxypeptidase regulatory-like domain-containing protein [Anaerolineae bacterium]
MPGLEGVYVYGDFCTGMIWTAFRDGEGTWQNALFKDTNYSISSFGEDAAGELYLLDYNGKLVKFEPLNPPTSTPQPATHTAVPPTSTSIPTNTPILPTQTSIPSTNTPTLAPTNPTLKAEFVPSSANPGENVNLQLNLYNVANVYGLQVQCQVDPGALTGGNYTEGEFNSSNSYFVDQEFQPDGSWLIGASRLQPSTPISGNVTAFSLNYTVSGPGDTEANCTALIVDQNGDEIAVDMQNGIFDGIEPPVQTEEPTQPSATSTPTNTPLPPTETPIPPTATPVPPTETPIPTALSSVKGVVRFQNRPDNAGITIRLLDGNGTSPVELMTAPDGSYQFTDVPVGSYNLHLSAPGHLAVTQAVTVDADGKIIDAGSMILRAGDTDQNGAIDLQDAALIGANFGVTAPPAPSEAD